MDAQVLLWLSLSIFVVAILYASVGHAGASGYIAVMSLAGLSPELLKPIALSLNILVASIGFWQFRRAGHFSWQLFWPFALLAIPAAFVGGYVNLPAEVFHRLVGLILLYSAVQFLFKFQSTEVRNRPKRWVCLASGSCIGLLSGMTGTGGGIFLTPLLLLMKWAKTKETAAVSVLFILFNSSAGLLGNMISTNRMPMLVVPLVLAALSGGLIGAHFGSFRATPEMIKKLLAIVLLIAGFKLVFV